MEDDVNEKAILSHLNLLLFPDDKQIQGFSMQWRTC